MGPSPDSSDTSAVLLSGITHVAVLTGDTRRFLEFYSGVFDAAHEVLQEREGEDAESGRCGASIKPRPHT